jgi:hypothetical protein
MGVLSSFYEKDLEAMIMENLPTMKDRGLPIFYKNTRNQVPLILDGICDILTWEIVNDKLFIRFIELKRHEVDIPALFQSIKYYQNSFLLRKSFFDFSQVFADIVLIGSERSDNLEELTYLNITNLSVYKYDFGFNGLFFNKIENRCQEFLLDYGADVSEYSAMFQKSKDLLAFLRNAV